MDLWGWGSGACVVSNCPGVFGCHLTCVKHWSGERIEEGRAPSLRKVYICTLRRRSQQRHSRSSQRNRRKIRRGWCLRGQERRGYQDLVLN